MTVFKGMLLHFWRYKIMVIIVTFLFFGIAVLFAQNQSADVFETSSMDIKVVNQADSEIADGLIDHLSTNNNVDVVNDYDRNQVIEEVYLLEIDGAVVIDENIESKFMNGASTVEILTDPRGSGSIHLNNEVSKYFRFLNADYNYTDTVDTENTLSTLENGITVNIANPENATEESDFEGMKFYTNYAGYIIMLLLLMFIGNIMTEFNEPNLRNRARVSPLKTISYTTQIISAQSIMAVFAVLILFFGGIFIRWDSLDGVPLDKMFVALILISLFTLSLQFVVSSLTTNKFLINGIANFISIGMAFLSGIFIPEEVLGETVQNISRFLPLYHFTQIYGESGITWSESIYHVMILVLFIIAMLIIGIIFENKRKSSFNL